jgi:TDG/mug DNA glycosylase family protein
MVPDFIGVTKLFVVMRCFCHATHAKFSFCGNGDMTRKKAIQAERPWRPTAADMAEAHRKRLGDVIDTGLRVLFVGINPGLYTAAIGHHFGRPGNRFWPALHGGGFTPRVYSPFESGRLVDLGLGITNLVGRPTTRADELTREELQEGVRRLERKVRRYRPKWLAFLGLTSYRVAMGQPRAVLGAQPERIAGAAVWLLPNPSGLNAHHQAGDLARLFGELKVAAGKNG